MEEFVFSIHSKHAENIYNGKKLYEFRKVLPKTLIRGDLIWLYETAPVQSVTGWCICDYTITGTSGDTAEFDYFWTNVKDGAVGTSKDDLNCYFNNKIPKAVKIKQVYKLSNPIPSNQIGWKRPPQNFTYCESIPNSFLQKLRKPTEV